MKADMNVDTEHHMSPGSHGTNWHMLLMLFCCLAPVAAIVAIGVFGVPFNAVMTLALVALCPLMMLFMMGGHSNSPRQQ